MQAQRLSRNCSAHCALILRSGMEKDVIPQFFHKFASEIDNCEYIFVYIHDSRQIQNPTKESLVNGCLHRAERMNHEASPPCSPPERAS